MIWWLKENQFKTLRKQAIVAYFKVLSRRLGCAAAENRETPESAQAVSRPGYEPRVPKTQRRNANHCVATFGDRNLVPVREIKCCLDIWHRPGYENGYAPNKRHKYYHRDKSARKMVERTANDMSPARFINHSLSIHFGTDRKICQLQREFGHPLLCLAVASAHTASPNNHDWSNGDWTFSGRWEFSSWSPGLWHRVVL